MLPQKGGEVIVDSVFPGMREWVWWLFCVCGCFVPAQRAAGALRRDRNWDQRPGQGLAKLRSVSGPSTSSENLKKNIPWGLYLKIRSCMWSYFIACPIIKPTMTMVQKKGWPSGCRFSVPRYAGMGVVVVLCLWVFRSGATRRRRVAPGSKLGSKAGPRVGEIKISVRAQYFIRKPEEKYTFGGFI